MGLTGFELQDMHTRRTENDNISSLAWRTSETMAGATPRTQIGLEAATASGTGQRDFWSTGFSFTSAFYIFYNSMSRAQAATASAVPVLVAPHILQAHAKHSCSSACLVPFQDLSLLRAGWPTSELTACQPQPATTENTFSISP